MRDATCLLALDAKSGRLLVYNQPTPDDFYDGDVAALPALITTRGGRQLAATGGKDGLLHGLDVSHVNRAVADGVSSKPQPADKFGAAGQNAIRSLYQTPVTRRFNTTEKFSTTKYTRFAPSTQGVVEWNGPSYHAPTNLVVVPAVDVPAAVKIASPSELQGEIAKV